MTNPWLPQFDGERAVRLVAQWKDAPYYRLLGIDVEELGAGRARLSMPWRDDFLQPVGVAHGGVLASLADSAAAWAVLPSLLNPKATTTIEMKINFLRPLRNEGCTAEARVIHRGRKTAVLEVDVTSDAGKLVARALTTYYLFPPGPDASD